MAVNARELATRVRRSLARADRFLRRYFNRILPQNLTACYLLGLGLIAALAIAGQILIQVSLVQQTETQRRLRLLDRKFSIADDLRRTSLALQLSGSRREAAERLEALHTSLGRLTDAHSQMRKSRAFSQDFPEMASLDRSLEALSRSIQKMPSLRRGKGASSFRPGVLSREVLDQATNHQIILRSTTKALEERFVVDVARFRKIEFSLFLAMLLVLLLEGLYVFRPAVERLYLALRARTDFLSRMSHELRNPMNSIMGMANLIAETPLTDHQRSYMNVLQRSSSGLLEILNRLLDFSSYESGKVRIEQIPFDLYEVLERSLDLSVVAAHAVGTELTLDLDPDLPLRTLGDPIRIQQVLTNLLGNAAKFTKSGDIVLRVQREGEFGRVRFSVIDSGIGIELDKLQTIFDPFVQEDSSIRRRYGGSGLGLSIAKELVELMGGAIEASSEKGRGSHFSFWLPLRPNPDDPSPLARRIERLGDSFAVVVWSANPNTLASIRKPIEASGGKILLATGCTELSRLLKEDRASVAVIDVAGDRAALREALGGGIEGPLFSRVIFLVTTATSTQEVERLVAAGTGALLFKPVRPVQLHAEIAHALSRTEKGLPSPSPRATRKEPLMEPASFPTPTRVLIAEDSVDNQTLFRAYLRSTRYSLDFAGNGNEAFEKFKQGEFDVVLMDIQMPEMDGYTATRLIRGWEKSNGRKETPIVAVSAHDMSEDTASSGFSAYLVKPVSAEGLKKTLQSVTLAKPPKEMGSSRGAPPALDAQIAQLVPTYLANRRNELAMLKAMLEAMDFEGIERVGHKLKGNARTYGFPRLGEIGAELELSGRGKDMKRSRVLIGEIEDFLKTVKG